MSRLGLVVAALMLWVAPPPALAIEPPTVPARDDAPADPAPGPAQPMRADNTPCSLPGVLPAPAVTDLPAALAMLGIERAHELSRGDGVKVAVIDTGVAPNARLPHLDGGGDYVADTDGLTDCDMHGTLVAGVIAAAPAPGDRMIGVAPGASLISIRHWSRNYRPEQALAETGLTTAQAEQAEQLRALARAVVHAANMGARVINISVVSCIPAAHPINQDELGAAVRYAAVVKDAVIVAAAGNTGAESAGCQSNPDYDPLLPDDPRNWAHVSTVSTPAWFSDYVISVGAVDDAGAEPDKTTSAQFSMLGPWVDLAAPGTNIISIGPDAAAVNALPGRDGLVTIFGTSFSAAYVSGVAALVRAKFPDLSAAQVRARLTATAHTPPRGVDNAVGHGLVDPVAALSYELPAAPREIVEHHRAVLFVPPPPPAPDYRAHHMALGIAAAAAVVGVAAAAVGARRRGGQR